MLKGSRFVFIGGCAFSFSTADLPVIFPLKP
jgi:hypothetical protein